MSLYPFDFQGIGTPAGKEGFGKKVNPQPKIRLV